MTDIGQSGQQADAGPAFESRPVTGWVAWVIFAGVIMLINGSFSAIAGLIALFKDSYYLVGPNGLAVDADYTAWGWLHLVLGILVAGAGLGALAGQTWARAVGVILASLSAIINFAFLAAYPVWATIVITLDVFVIYALIVHGGEARELR